MATNYGTAILATTYLKYADWAQKQHPTRGGAPCGFALEIKFRARGNEVLLGFLYDNGRDTDAIGYRWQEIHMYIARQDESAGGWRAIAHENARSRFWLTASGEKHDMGSQCVTIIILC